MKTEFAKLLRVRPGRQAGLSKLDPRGTPGGKNKAWAAEALEKNIRRLDDLQYRLYAENSRAVLIVLQGMDAAGKDGTIRNVMRGMNPQGCTVTSFKKPSAEELDHDFLWRIHKAIPCKGDFGIFNRSHYEDVLIVRVHQAIPKQVWENRYRQINEFERMLSGNRVTIVKFFLHIDKDEQLERMRERFEDPKKRWKFNPGDLEERKLWGSYMAAYEDALSRCSTPWAPWYVIPANHKWYRNLAVSAILVETLEKLDLQVPQPAFDFRKIELR